MTTKFEEEEKEEVELELCLSLGGASKKTEKSTPRESHRDRDEECIESETIKRERKNKEQRNGDCKRIKRECKETTRKPPKPRQSFNGKLLPFDQMPCVTSTGNGPEGKTVNGFLYRYSKSEISIICVCHGTSFSPAEVIIHGGGTHVSHPLRHITVVPSSI